MGQITCRKRIFLKVLILTDPLIQLVTNFQYSHVVRLAFLFDKKWRLYKSKRFSEEQEKKKIKLWMTFFDKYKTYLSLTSGFLLGFFKSETPYLTAESIQSLLSVKRITVFLSLNHFKYIHFDGF